MGKREIIGTLQMSVNIAKDAIEALKSTNAIKATYNVKLKVRNAELEAINESTNIQLAGLNKEITKQANQVENLLSENSRLLHSIPHKNPRTYFEIASSEPLKSFEVGDTVHTVESDLGVVYNQAIIKGGISEYPIETKCDNYKQNGKHYQSYALRSLFTTAEMIEMGYEVPDLE